MDLSRQLDRAQSRLEKSGVEAWEVWASAGRSLTVGIHEDKVDNLKASAAEGLAVRVIKDGRVGFSFQYGDDPQGLALAVEQAVAAAAAVDPEPAASLTGTAAALGRPEVFDQALAQDSQESQIERARALAAAAREVDRRIVSVHPAEVSQSQGASMMRNSLGQQVEQAGTRISAGVMAMAQDNGESEQGWESQSARFLEDLPVAEVGRLAGQRAAGALGAAPVASGRYNVILERQVAAGFISHLAHSLTGDNVHKGRSLLASKMGQQVVSPVLSLRDDGLYPRGPGSAAFDGEGTPQQSNPLITDGVLVGFVYDRLYGALAGAASTGNAVRPSLAAPPAVGFHNLLVEPGNLSFQELLGRLHRGLLITEVLGGHTADPVSGEFSFGAVGHLVEGGRISRPVKSIAIAGQVLDLMGQVSEIGSDVKFRGRCGCPSLLVEGFSVSGP